MQTENFSGKWQSGDKMITLSVALFVFEEDGIHYAYLPSMDLTGYGKTPKEARESLKIVLDEFFRYTINKNTFFAELEKMGWKIRSKHKPMTPPRISDLINENDQLKDIVDSKQYTSSSYQINVPVYA